MLPSPARVAKATKGRGSLSKREIPREPRAETFGLSARTRLNNFVKGGRGFPGLQLSWAKASLKSSLNLFKSSKSLKSVTANWMGFISRNKWARLNVEPCV